MNAPSIPTIFFAALTFFFQAATGATFNPTVTEEALIDQLQDINSAGTGYHPTAFSGSFIAIDAPPKFRGGIMGSQKPEVHPAMRELVRRGTASLPALLKHLDDTRSTGLTVGEGFMGKWFAAEYDPRDRSKPLPEGVQNLYDLTNTEDTFTTYTVTVGDLCYVTIGQIVNRSLNAVRYQPTLCLVVNSMANPALIRAVREDWTGCTPEMLKDSLTTDAMSRDLEAAIQRLLYYFPETGHPLTVRLLNRALVNSDTVDDFIRFTLLKSRDDSKTRSALHWFIKTYTPQDWAGLIHQLQLRQKRSRETTSQVDDQAIALEQVLHLIAEDETLAAVELVPAAVIGTQHRLVEAVHFYPSEEIDAAVLDLLQRAMTVKCKSDSNRFSQCELVEACLVRLLRPDNPNQTWRDDKDLTSSIQKFCTRILRENRGATAPGVKIVTERIQKLLENTQE